LSTGILFKGARFYNEQVPVTTSSLLFEKFIEYQQKVGGRKSLKEFAAYIGIGPVHLNRLMNERRSPGEKTVAKLSEFFQDYRFYDAVGLPRPDPDLQNIIKDWQNLPDDAKQSIREIMAEYHTNHE
jgi:transcriptional regulator with XRE-family HTH domain